MHLNDIVTEAIECVNTPQEAMLPYSVERHSTHTVSLCVATCVCFIYVHTRSFPYVYMCQGMNNTTSLCLYLHTHTLQALGEAGKVYQVQCLAFRLANLSSSLSDPLFIRVFGKSLSLSLSTNHSLSLSLSVSRSS